MNALPPPSFSFLGEGLLIGVWRLCPSPRESWMNALAKGWIQSPLQPPSTPLGALQWVGVVLPLVFMVRSLRNGYKEGLSKLIVRLTGDVMELVRNFAADSVKSFTLGSLLSVRRRALRVGAWFKVSPLRRGLLEAAIAFMRRGVIRSGALMGLIREALAEALALLLVRKTAALAYVVGARVAERIGVKVEGRLVMVVGLQWLNTPFMYRSPIA